MTANRARKQDLRRHAQQAGITYMQASLAAETSLPSGTPALLYPEPGPELEARLASARAGQFRIGLRDDGTWHTVDLHQTDGLPHLFIAGRTGDGKTTLLNTIVSDAALTHDTPHRVRICDPKRRLHRWQGFSDWVDYEDSPDRIEASLGQLVRGAQRGSGPRTILAVDDSDILNERTRKYIEGLTRLGRRANITVVQTMQRPKSVFGLPAVGQQWVLVGAASADITGPIFGPAYADPLPDPRTGSWRRRGRARTADGVVQSFRIPRLPQPGD